jgi:hypothetical protein
MTATKVVTIPSQSAGVVTAEISKLYIYIYTRILGPPKAGHEATTGNTNIE